MNATPTTIVVLPAGWVFVGNLAKNGDGTETLTNASNVRRYFTKAGLGPLAEGGPKTEGCILDKVNDVTFNANSVIVYIACNEEAWS